MLRLSPRRKGKGEGDKKGSGLPPQPGDSDGVNWLQPHLYLESGEEGRGPVWAEPGLEVIPRVVKDTQHTGLRSDFIRKSLLREDFPL